MAHEPSLFPNSTLFIQMGIFASSFLVMRKFLFAPFLALIDKRNAMTVELKERAREERERAEKLRLDYETFIQGERKKVSQWADDERRKLGVQEREIIQEARVAVGEQLRQVREQVHTESEAAREDLMPTVTEVSTELVSKIMGGTNLNLDKQKGAGKHGSASHSWDT